ncbi:hypothetical protein ACM26V_19300 [Salipaludibacillus sp. HK11]|uniref:hypothetical protein n=1 Tax=Salipaludibacillus sp. HK11 TaxID=3394320 RepID=UPI0039FD261F
MNNVSQLLNGIFLCGASEVKQVTQENQVKTIVDVRAEATESIVNNASWIHVPLQDGKPNQSILLSQAISAVVDAYQQGNQIILH